jgi:hypothetical protein
LKGAKIVTTKYTAGFSWGAYGGMRVIVGQAKDRNVGWMEIRNVDGSDSYVHVEDIENEISFDKVGYENWLADTKAKEVADAQAKAKEASWNGYANDLPPMRKAKVRNALEKQVRFETKIMTRKEFVELLCSRGAELETGGVPRVKDMSAKAFFRASAEVQQSYIEKQNSAGNKTEYLLGGYVITKTEYDYALWVKAENLLDDLAKNSLGSHFGEQCPKCQHLRHIGFWGESAECEHCAKHEKVSWKDGECAMFAQREN